MQKKYHFEYILSYQGEAEYKAIDLNDTNKQTREHRISHRTGLSDYLKTYYNGTAEEYERDIIGSLYYITYYDKNFMTPELVSEFKAYLQDEWNKQLIGLKARAEKYKNNPEIALIYEAYGPATPLVKGGACWEKGWQVV